MATSSASGNRGAAPSVVPYSHLEHGPSESTADPDDMDTGSMGSDLVLADMSDSDTRSVDFLLDDFGCVDTSRGFPKVSV